MSQIPVAIQSYKRRAWKPLTADGDGSLTASKFGGQPWLEKGEKWPKCAKCNNFMQFFLQLNLDELSQSVIGEFGRGILQIFYCLECDDYEPFSPSHFLRIIQATTEVKNV